MEATPCVTVTPSFLNLESVSCFGETVGRIVLCNTGKVWARVGSVVEEGAREWVKVGEPGKWFLFPGKKGICVCVDCCC